MVKVYCQNCSGRCVGDVLKVGTNYFHQKCFKCKDCKKKLDTGGFFCRNDSYYCKQDYTNRFSNVCFICKSTISSEIVSALNHHFHKDCFQCNSCSKTFVPGDRVVMKNDQFVCQQCLMNKRPSKIPYFAAQEKFASSDTTAPTSIHPSNNTQKEILSDDATTDQGYISADPTSISSPIQIDEIKPKTCRQDLRKPKWRSCRNIFEFGHFYNTSYLKIQEKEQQQKIQQQKKQLRAIGKWTDRNIALRSDPSTSTITPSRFSSNYQLPISKSLEQGQSKSSHNGMVSLLSMPLTAMAAGIKKPQNKYLRKAASSMIAEVSRETDSGDEVDHVVRLASYPAGARHPDNEPLALERDDWPAPLYSAIIYREKMLQSKMKGRTRANNEPVDCTQSLDQLSPNLSNNLIENDNNGLSKKVKLGRLPDLIDVLYGSNQSACSRQTLNGDVVSISRSPNADIEPSIKLRYINHSDKSNSRNASYFNNSERNKGLSMDYISSTSRPFLAGSIAPTKVSRQQTAHEMRLNSLIYNLMATKSAVVPSITSNVDNINITSSNTLLQNLHSTRASYNVLSTDSDTNNVNNNNNNNNLHGSDNLYYRNVDPGLSWNATRTLSDNFDVQLKNTSEYDSTIEETLFENIEEEGNGTNNNALVATTTRIAPSDHSSSLSHVDLTTGLRQTRRVIPRTRSRDHTITGTTSNSAALNERGLDTHTSDDRSSLNSRAESMENWSFWSQKPAPGLVKTPNKLAYADLVIKDPKIMRGLDKHKLESYLSIEEFQLIFGVNRTDFYRLPEWKRNDLKRRVDLF